MKKTLKLMAYVLSFVLLGGMASCNSENEQEGEVYYFYLDGAYLEDSNNGIFVFDGNGTFLSYENDWLYTANIESYSYGTWHWENSTLILTYTEKYEKGKIDQNFKMSTKTFILTNYIPNTQAFVWTTENGQTLTFQKYVRKSVEQYLKNFLVGKWKGMDGNIYDIKADNTFIITKSSTKEYGHYSINESLQNKYIKRLTFYIEGYYDANNKELSYSNPKIENYDIESIDPLNDRMRIDHTTLDQGGGFTDMDIWIKND